MMLSFRCVSQRSVSMTLSRLLSNSQNASEAAFQTYLTSRQALTELRAQLEQEKSRNMYQAWQKTTAAESQTHNNNNNNKEAGVQVIRTLAQTTKKGLSKRQQLEQDVQTNLQLAVQQSHPKALLIAANQRLKQYTNSNKNDDIQTAIDYYQLAGRAGEAEAWFNLGHFYWTGCNNGLPPDRSKAMEYFEMAAALNDRDALYFLGVVKMEEESQALQIAYQYLQRAATLEHGGALLYLVLLHKNGHAGLGLKACTTDEFRQSLDDAVRYDTNGEALFVRGSCFCHGSDGYPLHKRRALEDFLQAADLGHADAAVSAGALYFHGHDTDIPPNKGAAFDLYQRAGELGSVEGWRNVVSCYVHGHGVKQSLETAKYIAETMLQDKDDAVDNENDGVESENSKR